MALEIRHSINAISSDCVDLTFIDNTGVYDIVDNPGGYGSFNKERNTLAAFLAVFAYVQDDDDDPLVVDNSQPLTADTWIVPTTRDGYVHSTLLLIDIWNGVDTYAVDDIVYESAVYYKSRISGNTNILPSANVGTAWDIVTDPYVERANVDPEQVGNNDDVVMCRVDTCYAEEIKRVNSGKACTDCSRKATWIKMDVLRQGAQVNCEQLLFREADEIVIQLQNECESLECVTCNPR